MSFEYTGQLNSDQLRLLRPILINHQQLDFEVTTVTRRNAPTYTAVSYTWGGDQSSETIRLNGRIFPVRPNLWSCLYYLGRHTQSPGWECKYLWVDAICINQNNNDEKSSQVRLMDETYKAAAYVSVWLGLVSPPRDLYVRYVRHQVIKTAESDSFSWAESIQDVANRPYWSRFWVIQEFLLGKDVILFCSNNYIHWRDFQWNLGKETGFYAHDDRSSTHDRFSDLANRFTALPLVMGRHPDRFPELYQSLYGLLIDHRGSECKDPKDRIFALMGLITPDERRLLGRAFPNYSLSHEHVLVITLAHLTQFSPLVNDSRYKTITPQSEEIWDGLGVPSIVERRRLLRIAEGIDYSDSWTLDELLHHIRFNEEMMLSHADNDSGRNQEEALQYNAEQRAILSHMNYYGSIWRQELGEDAESGALRSRVNEDFSRNSVQYENENPEQGRSCCGRSWLLLVTAALLAAFCVFRSKYPDAHV